jgi:hypothetical protein
MSQEQLIGELTREISSGNIVAVAGTGVSIMACEDQKVDGHPVARWDGLLLHGVDYCVNTEHVLDKKDAELLRLQIGSGKPDFLVFAAELISEALRKKSPGTYHGWLKRTVGQLEPTSPSVLHLLGRLGGVLATPNYDPLFEVATGRMPVTWKDREKVESVLRGKSEPAIFHIHGYYDDPDSVVLGLSSYAKVKADPHTATVLRLFTLGRTLLFCGLSRHDWRP